ncbi:PepSY-associated TM helix domain-containing protein [Chryseobacterium sp. A301]
MAKKKRALTGQLHLYLGLLVGVIVFILSLSGSLYVFKDEVQNSLRREAIWHQNPEALKKAPLKISQIMERVGEQKGPKEPIGWITVPLNKQKTYWFHLYKRNRDGNTYLSEFELNKSAYVDPFTGKIKAIYDERTDFFFITLRLHYSLLLGGKIGSWVAGIATLIFVVMLITGLILWFPKKKINWKKALTFQWKKGTSWKRKNYDLHNVLGFYSAFVGLILGITGLYYAFKIVPTILYFVFSGGASAPDYTAGLESQTKIVLSQGQVLDRISEQIEAAHPTAASYDLMIEGKGKAGDPQPYILVQVRQLEYSLHQRHKMYFDKNSGDLLLHVPYGHLGFGEKAVLANFDVHTGQIWGLFGKVIAFLAGLVLASLPVTGFLIWWAKRKKAKRKTRSL